MQKSANFHKEIVKSREKFSTFSGKFYNFLKKICRFIQENLTVFARKCEKIFVEIPDGL